MDAIVEGTVLRSGDKVRITAQLIEASADKHLWAQSYERDLKAVLVLQHEIASAIAKQIRMTLTPGEQIRAGTEHPVNLEAYESYWRGEYFLNRGTPDSIRKAADYFQQAIEKDPNYPAPKPFLGSRKGRYARKHVPFLDDDGHDPTSNPQQGLEKSADWLRVFLTTWLHFDDKTWVPKDEQLKRTLVIITFDESEGNTQPESILRTIEDNFGLDPIHKDSGDGAAAVINGYQAPALTASDELPSGGTTSRYRHTFAINT